MKVPKFIHPQFAIDKVAESILWITLVSMSLNYNGAFAQVESINTRLWPDKWANDLTNSVDRSGTAVTNLIFDQIDDFYYTFVEKIDFKFKAGVKRTVFDNQDVLGTWTVNDNFKIELGHNKTEYEIPLVPSLITPIAFKLGIEGTLSVSHFRQIRSYEYQSIPRQETDQEGEVEEQEPNSTWIEFDPSSRPRLSRILNPLMSVTKIPWSKKLLKNLQNSELVSYSASGYVSTGIEMGLIPIKVLNDVNLKLTLGSSVYVGGEFRITVLKESDRYVRVKLTKISSRGTEITAGSSAKDVEVFKGFSIFGVEDIGKTKLNITPFNFSFKKSRNKQFDLGFRYDLEDEEAVKAYQMAVTGQFQRSEELAKNKDSSVVHILTRNSKEKKKQDSLNLGVDWLIKKKLSRISSDQEIEIMQPDGIRKIYKNSLKVSNSWSTVIGNGESKSYNFFTIFDKVAYENGEKNSFQLVTEGLIEDVYTTSREMNTYTTMVERIIGTFDPFPELPFYNPPEEGKKTRRAIYGRSSFYFGQFFSQDQVVKFIKTPRERAREITKKCFVYSNKKREQKITKDFLEHWMEIQNDYEKINDSMGMVEVLNKITQMFNNYGRSIHGMIAVLMSLDKEEIDYFLTASNSSFGRVQRRGKYPTNAEKLLELADNSINFETTISSSRADVSMDIKDFKVVQQEDKSLKINFVLPKNTNYIFFRLMRSSGWKKVKNVKEIIFYNKGKFSEGANEWIVKPNSSSVLDRSLLESFTKSEYYTLQMSGTSDRQSWGRTTSSRLRVIVETPE